MCDCRGEATGGTKSEELARGLDGKKGEGRQKGRLEMIMRNGTR